jgi:hypothetical protein
MPIQFFTAIDRNKDGKIKSDYPAWTFPQQIENAKEEIGMKERALQSGSVDRESEGEYKLLLERESKRLEAIENSRPKLDAIQIDLCDKVYKDLKKGIQDSMPSYSDIHMNFVDGHEEHRRNSKPCIKVTGKTAELAQNNSIRVSDKGEMSRKDASKLYKIIGHAIGKDTNVERLRKIGKLNPTFGRTRR